MDPRGVQELSKRAWRLVGMQHAVVSRRQLLALGFSAWAIRHRLATGRLHPIPGLPGVYAVGRPQLTREGRWMAAVLACQPGAVLSHGSAAAHWQIGEERPGRIELSVPATRCPRPRGLIVHRRVALRPGDVTNHMGVPVTTPICTVIDLATYLSQSELERAINEADKHDLVSPEDLRSAIEAPALRCRKGIAMVRTVLDRRTFTLTDSELERLFLPITRRAGLPVPQTQQRVNGFKVDFYWPELGLVVETDGLRYHRTPAEQARDRLRDQAHTAAGLTPLRFAHAQVRFEPEHVRTTLAAVADRLQANRL